MENLKSKAAVVDGTNVVLYNVMGTFPNLLNPRADLQGNVKQSIRVVIPKTRKEDIEAINQAIENARQAGIEKGTFSKKEKVKSPLRDADDEDKIEKYPELEGCMFINANNSKCNAPVFSKYRTSDGKILRIEDEDEIYSGAIFSVRISFYPFDARASKGIAAWLVSVKKEADGERIGGVVSNPLQDFDFEEVEEEEDPFK